MKKSNIIRGNLVCKTDGKVEFTEDPAGKILFNRVTCKIHNPRPWVIRKLHSWLWRNCVEISFFMFIMGGAIAFFSFAYGWVYLGYRESGMYKVLFISHGIVLLSIICGCLARAVNEPKDDDCDC
jgi:hypothetical protein